LLRGKKWGNAGRGEIKKNLCFKKASGEWTCANAGPQKDVKDCHIKDTTPIQMGNGQKKDWVQRNQPSEKRLSGGFPGGSLPENMRTSPGFKKSKRQHLQNPRGRKIKLDLWECNLGRGSRRIATKRVWQPQKEQQPPKMPWGNRRQHSKPG